MADHTHCLCMCTVLVCVHAPNAFKALVYVHASNTRIACTHEECQSRRHANAADEAKSCIPPKAFLRCLRCVRTRLACVRFETEVPACLDWAASRERAGVASLIIRFVLANSSSISLSFLLCSVCLLHVDAREALGINQHSAGMWCKAKDRQVGQRQYRQVCQMQYLLVSSCFCICTM